MITTINGSTFYASEKTMDKNHIIFYRVIKDEDAIALLDKLNEKLMKELWSKELPRKYEIDSCILCVANPFDDSDDGSYYLPCINGDYDGHSENCCICFPSREMGASVEMSKELQNELTNKVIDYVRGLGIDFRLADTDGNWAFFDIDYDQIEEVSKNF